MPAPQNIQTLYRFHVFTIVNFATFSPLDLTDLLHNAIKSFMRKKLTRKNKIIIATCLIAAALILVLVGGYVAFRRGLIRLPAKMYLHEENIGGDMTTLTLDEISDEYPQFEINQALLLVNEEHRLDEDFEADLVYYKDTDVLMNSCIVDSYATLSAEILDTFDNKLFVESSYRTYQRQVELYEELGPEIAAVPGSSEHQTGLSLDVYVMYYGGMGFYDSDEGQFVNRNCGDYGFIIRYDRNLEDITGFAFEPWHIRYVGLPHSQIIEQSGIALEQYIEALELGQYYSYDNYLIGRFEENEIQIPSEYLDAAIENEDYTITISPDNTGAAIVTIQLLA